MTLPLHVFYTRKQPEGLKADEFALSVVTPENIVALRAGIEDGSINTVILHGPKVALGWRIYTSRAIIYTSDCKNAAEVAQAGMRIVQT